MSFNNPENRIFNLQNTQINSLNKVKFLGLTFQSNLKWNAQILSCEKKCANSIKTMKCLGKKKWGSDPNVLLRIYRALIRSRIEYGGLLFHNISLELSAKMDKLQMRALRIAMGYRNSTPLNVILAESREPSLFFRFKYLGLNFLNRVHSLSSHVLNETVNSLSNISFLRPFTPAFIPLVKTYKDFLPLSQWFPSQSSPICFPSNYQAFFFQPKIDTYTGTHLYGADDPMAKFNFLFEEELKSTQCLYTDGSTQKGASPSGYAVISNMGETLGLFQSAGFISSFCAESLAILEALKIIQTNGWKKSTIFSDSLFNLVAIESTYNHISSSHIILNIKDLLYTLSLENYQIKLIWIPSHHNIRGNELADSEAKRARQQGDILHANIPLKEGKNLWKSSTIQESLDWCRNEATTRGSYYFSQFDSPSINPWFHSLSLKRRTISSINRLRSGHTSLHSSLFRFMIVDSPDCPYCGELESPEHVFWSCFNYESQRSILLQDLQEDQGMAPHSLEHLLTLPSNKVITALEKFICSIPTFI